MSNEGLFAAYWRKDLKAWWYAAQKPGDGGVDWGWTTNPNGKSHPDGTVTDPAIRLTTYWQRRFAKHCRDCGQSQFKFLETV